MKVIDTPGYPTQDDLDKLANWKIYNDDDFVSAMEYARALWRDPEHFCSDDMRKIYIINVFVWYSNKDVVDAINKNDVLKNEYFYCAGGVRQHARRYIYAPKGIYISRRTARRIVDKFHKKWYEEHEQESLL